MSSDQKSDDSVLVRAAKKIGSAVGRVASAVGADEASASSAAPDAPPKTGKSKTAGKLQKKNKTRLPRRMKKALLKKAEKQA